MTATPPTIHLREVTDANRADVTALRVSPAQTRFVGTVDGALEDAAEYPIAAPWFRAVYDGETPVGFVMLSWDVTPVPGKIIGPWFLWKLLVDERFQGRGYGTATLRAIVDTIGAEGATELLTSYVPGEGGPWPFYQRFGFAPTGELDEEGEIILRLPISPG